MVMMMMVVVVVVRKALTISVPVFAKWFPGVSFSNLVGILSSVLCPLHEKWETKYPHLQGGRRQSKRLSGPCQAVAVRVVSCGREEHPRISQPSLRNPRSRLEGSQVCVRGGGGN